MRNNSFNIMIFILGLIWIGSCEVLEPSAPMDHEVLDGPIDGILADQRAQFLAGDNAFNKEIFTTATGLGPLFVATSCGSCHAGDGKGHPFTSLVRFGQKDQTGNHYLNQGGPQLQNRSIPGFTPEQIPLGATHATFTPPANTGLGYIELVSDEDLLALADPDDKNGDGISGVPNWNTIPGYVDIPSHAIIRDGKYICRFGKKASTFNLLHQTVNAYNQDMGITSTFFPIDQYSSHAIGPEVSDLTVRNVVSYLQTLKAPIARNVDQPTIKEGATLFIQTGCESCHQQTLHTSISKIAALSDKIFHPYTDLLLHDMGSGLDDGYTEGSAKSSEWRTPPLWGLGLSPNAQGGQYYLLHDGRATSIEQAIELHGGEALNAVNKYKSLAVADRNKLIQFLKSL